VDCCLRRLNYDIAMAQQRAEIERLNGTLSSLRQERDRIIMVSLASGLLLSQWFVWSHSTDCRHEGDMICCEQRAAAMASI
jgi:hypothetical protein